ncbi:MAG: hypothetical protein K5859_08890 [Atopobiaceae bacterium]|nr:hypothetical protein [Atopobiaceae bacterium]
MIEEHRKVYRISLAIVLAAAALALPFDRTIAASLIMGIAFLYVYLRVLTSTVTAQLEAATGAGRMPSAVGFLLHMLVLALPLLIAARFQEHFNILAAFAPLFINHIATFIIYGVLYRGVSA